MQKPKHIAGAIDLWDEHDGLFQKCSSWGLQMDIADCKQVNVQQPFELGVVLVFHNAQCWLQMLNPMAWCLPQFENFLKWREIKQKIINVYKEEMSRNPWRMFSKKKKESEKEKETIGR